MFVLVADIYSCGYPDLPVVEAVQNGPYIRELDTVSDHSSCEPNISVNQKNSENSVVPRLC